MNISIEQITFAFKFYEQIKLQSENICLCPLSVSLAFGIVLSGCRNSSRDQLREALAVVDSSDNLNQYLTDVTKLIRSFNIICHADNELELKLVNRLFLHEPTYSLLKHAFMQVAENNFLSSVEKVNFGDSIQASDTINNFVHEITSGKIQELFQPTSFNAYTRLVIVSAAYFKGVWEARFDKSATYDDIFYEHSGKKSKVKMMVLSNSTFYALNDTENKLQVVAMPFCGSHPIRMIVLFPTERTATSFQLLEEKLAKPSSFLDFIQSLKETRIYFSLPKFCFEYQTNVSMAMKAFGATDIFESSTANLSGICQKENLYVSNAIHKTYIKVDEDGCEAAAVTAITMCALSMPAKVSFSVKVDGPFMYMLWSDVFNFPLFIGRIKQL